MLIGLHSIDIYNTLIFIGEEANMWEGCVVFSKSCVI